jgi:hypothetical protein
MTRDHHQQMYQRISHHHICTLIKIKKRNQVSKKVKSVSLEKLDGPVYQTGVSDFGKTRIDLTEEDDHTTSSSNDNNTDDEYDDQELFLEFQKLICKHMKL